MEATEALPPDDPTSWHSRAAGLPSRVLTQAEIRYPRPVRPPAAVQSAFRYLLQLQAHCSPAQGPSVLRWQILPARVPPLTYFGRPWKRKDWSADWPSPI